MEGYSIDECIQEQRRINAEYYEKMKNINANNQNADQQWYTQGAPAAKVARTTETEKENQEQE